MLILCGIAVATALAMTSGDASSVTKLATGRHQILGYQLATDAQGAGTIVWATSQFVGDFADTRIRVTQQNSDGRWSAPTQLGGLHQSLNPVLAESASGAAVIAWSWVRGGPHERSALEAATRSSAHAPWSTPRTLWSSPHVDNALATAGIDSAGIATILWTSYGPANPGIWSTTINTASLAISTPQELIGDGAGGTDVSLAVNGAGAALLSWRHQLKLAQHKPGLPTVHAAEMVDYCPAHGHWLTPQRLSTFSYQQEPFGADVWGPGSPSSTVTAKGTAAVSWPAGDPGNGAPLDISTRDPMTGNWSPTHRLDRTTASDPAIAAGPDQSLLALWSSNDEGGLLTATSAQGNHWSAARSLSGTLDGSDPSLASDTDGTEVIAIAGRRSRILLSSRTATHGWSGLKRAGTGFNPEVAASDNGSITVAWEQSVSAGGALETRTYH